MNNKIEKWALVMWIIILLGVLFSLLSCVSAEHHFQKFTNKGGRIESKIDSKDSVRAVTIVFPTPKWQVRLENKRFSDSLNRMNKRHRDSLANAYKVQQQKEQTGRREAKQDGKTERTQARQNGNTDRAGFKQDGKTERMQIKQANKTERKKGNRFAWVLLGMFIKPVIRFLYRKARDGLIYLKRTV